MIRYRWRSLLKAARSEHEVVMLVRSYLLTWKPEEVALIPPDIWPGQISSRRDVTDWTFRIGKAHSEFRGSAQQLGLLQDLLLFMTQASVRVTQLAPALEEDMQVATEPEEGIGGPLPEARAESGRSKT